MSLPIVFRQRFRSFVGRFTSRPPQPFPGSTTLRVATDLDDTDIDVRFRRALNRDDERGMGDVLKKAFGVGELKGSTRIDEVLAAMVKQAKVKNVDEYRALIRPRVVGGFSIVLAGMQFPPADPATIKPGDALSNYVTQANVHDVTKECIRRFDKWLLSAASADDFTSVSTIEEALENLLSRMVVL